MLRAYCRHCDAWFEQSLDEPCPDCAEPMEARTFRYPEDVFGPPGTEEPERGSVARGFKLLAIGHVVFLTFQAVGGLDFTGAVVVPVALATGQMGYGLPMVFVQARKGARETERGIVLGIGATFVLCVFWFAFSLV